MPKPAVMLSLLMLASCGAFKMFSTKVESKQERKIASVAMERLMTEGNQNFSEEIDDHLFSLHCYYLIAQKNLHHFDRNLNHSEVNGVYRSPQYYNLLAVRKQVVEIEKELVEIYSTLESGGSVEHEKARIMKDKISQFSQKSLLRSLAIRKVAFELKLPIHVMTKQVSIIDINHEYKELEHQTDFQIYQKNIEHLSHMIEMSVEQDKNYADIKKLQHATIDTLDWMTQAPDRISERSRKLMRISAQKSTRAF